MPKVIAPFCLQLALSLAAVFVLMTATACATTSNAPAEAQLTGPWQLDTAASDVPDAKIAAAVALAESKLRKRLASAGYGQYAPDSSGGGNGGGGGSGGHRGRGNSGGAELNGDEFTATGYIAPDFIELRRHLNEVLSTPRVLTIDAQPDFVRLAGDNMPPRDYPPGDTFTRIDEYGTARIDTKWSGNAFVLRARYSTHATVTATYDTDGHGRTLTVTRNVTDPVAGKISVRSIYRK
jgi:hypothetical protein